MPWNHNQVNFDPYTKTKSFSIPTQMQSHFRPHAIFDPHTKNKSIPIPARKISQLRYLHQNQVYFDPKIKTK